MPIAGARVPQRLLDLRFTEAFECNRDVVQATCEVTGMARSFMTDMYALARASS